MVLKSKPMVWAFKLYILFILTSFLLVCLVKLFGPAPHEPIPNHQVAKEVTF